MLNQAVEESVGSLIVLRRMTMQRNPLPTRCTKVTIDMSEYPAPLGYGTNRTCAALASSPRPGETRPPHNLAF